MMLEVSWGLRIEKGRAISLPLPFDDKMRIDSFKPPPS
jgi:hypothetical protein